MSENELAEGIKEWWVGAVGDRNRWNRGYVGPAIKLVVELSGNWKNAPRGNPRKAGRISVAKKQKELNYD